MSHVSIDGSKGRGRKVRRRLYWICEEPSSGVRLDHAGRPSRSPQDGGPDRHTLSDSSSADVYPTLGRHLHPACPGYNPQPGNGPPEALIRGLLGEEFSFPVMTVFHLKPNAFIS